MAPSHSRNEEETQDVENQQDEKQDSEQQPLLPSAAAEPKQLQKGLKVDHVQPLKQDDVIKGHSRSNSLSKQDSGQCRICLEEDSLHNLEAPCGCTGTQRYAHRECIQKWVNEKHDATCEICDQPYKGSYTVPPPPPQHEAGEQLQVVAPLGGLYLTVEDDRVGGLLSDVYDDWDDHRQPTVSWCFSVLMFLLFLMFLHSTVSVSIPNDPSSSSSSGGPGPHPGMDPSGAPAGGGSSSSLPGGAAAGFAAGVSLFVMWALTKLFLIMLPLLMVMRIAARAQEQAAETATAAAVSTVPGLDGPPAAAGQAGSNAGGASHYQSMVARIFGNNSSSGGGGVRDSSNPAGSRSNLADLEMEVLAARRVAFGRLGRDPTVFAPTAANAAASEVTGQQQQQREEVAAAEQRMMAAVRAMVRAALMNAAAQQERSRSGGTTDTAAGSATPARLSGVV